MKIKSFFNEIGSISFSNDNGVMYRINKLDDIINIIIPNKLPTFPIQLFATLLLVICKKIKHYKVIKILIK